MNARALPGEPMQTPPADRQADRHSIGELIRQLRRLNDSQVQDIMAHQRQHDLRFGEAAVALRLASPGDVLWALSRQFHYPYAADGNTRLSAELVAAVDPFHAQAEAIRSIRSQLLQGVMAPDSGRKALAVVSPDVGDGKSYFAANLAIAFSQLGARTLLLDADLRSARQHRLFAVSNASGLSDILASRAVIGGLHAVPELPSLFVLPVGALPPNPVELLQRPAFDRFLRDLLSQFEHVIVDTPAAVHGFDARVLAAKCGASLVIGRRGTSRMKALHELVDGLGRGTQKLAGVVINEH